MKKVQDFLFASSHFKRILSNLYIIPAFLFGFFVGEILDKTSNIPFLICLTIVIISFILVIWMVIYQICNNK